MSTQAEEREAQAKEEQASGKLTDLYAQVRDLRIETGDSGVGSIGGGLPSFIEQTAIAQGGEAFRHRWQVTATSEGTGDDLTWTLHVAPGSVWERTEDGALQEAEITPEGAVQADSDAGGWKIAPAASGALYVAQNADGAKSLRFGSTENEEDDVILRISDVTVTTSDPPTASIVQRQIGDFVLADPGQEETPVAWRVALRSKSVSSGTIDQWQIFAPTWTVGRETLLPEGMAEDWNDLDVTSGDLYAVLTWTGTATTDDAGEVKTTWTPGKPVITNDLSKIPADDDPTPDDPSTSTIEGKEGHRSIIVKIGTFLTDEKETPADPIAFLQIHTGSIIEDINTSTPAPAEEVIDNPAAWEVRAFNEEQEDGSKKKVWKIWSPNFYYKGIDGRCYPKSPTYYYGGWNALQNQPKEDETSTLLGYITWSETIDYDDNVPFVLRQFEECQIGTTPPQDIEPTRYTRGRKTLWFAIGSWLRGEWRQLHLGVFFAQFPPKTPFHEPAVLPTAFAITEEGKLEITTRNVKIPIAQRDNDDKILLDIPGRGASDVLGPIEWDASRNSFLQYLGKWTYNGSAWVFAKKMNGNVAYPPAAIYPVTAANLLVRANQYGTPDAAGDNIAVIPFNLPFASAAATTWLTKHESTVSNGVVYTPPETVDGSGSLDSKTFTLTYWTDTGETNRQTNNLLGSIVEAANQTSTYEG